MRPRTVVLGLSALAVVIAAAVATPAGVPAPVSIDSLPTYEVEWVYRVKWGHDEEFWQIFQKTQIPVLDREKELGYVLSYQVYRPGLHTSEDSRWNYRVVITYKNILSSTHGGALEKELFPDRAAYVDTAILRPIFDHSMSNRRAQV